MALSLARPASVLPRPHLQMATATVTRSSCWCCLALPPLGISGMHLLVDWRLEPRTASKAVFLGGLTRQASDPTDTSKLPSLIIYNFLFLELHCQQCQRDPSQMIHSFKTSSNMSCLEIKQQRGI